MNLRKSLPPADANEEVSALIATLHETGQRLEELTAGEVDTVADREGRTFLLRHVQEQLRHSEAARQAAILNALPAHIALLDTQGLIISVNDAWRQFVRANAIHGPGHAIGLNYLEICDSAGGDGSSEAHQVAEGIRSVLDGRAKSLSIEYACHSSTEQRWFLLMVTPLADERPNGAVVMHVDITERKRGEDKIVHLNRVYAMLSGIHTLIVRVQDRDELFREACRIAVEHGKFGIAWIGLLDPATLEVTPVACDGLDPTEHLGDFRSSAHADHPFGKGEVGRALRERKAAFSNNLSRTPSPAGERRKVALRSGYLSRIALPLLVENNPVGVIVLFARERDFFNEEELKLLSELAGDISFALENISRQQKLDKAAQELRESERRFSDLLRNVELVSLMLDCEARITYCNDYLLRLTGWRREEVIGRDWFELFIPPDVSDLKNTFAALIADLPEAQHHENEILTRSGERRLIRWNHSVLRSGVGDVVGTASIGENITERKAADEVLKKRADELERFHRLSVGRELQMIELKKQVNDLAKQAGQKLPYDLAFLGPKP